MMRARGVTLVELLVAIGIVAAVAVAGYAQHRATEGARVKSAAEHVASLLRRATQAAWAERTPYRAVFSPNTALVQAQKWSGSAWGDAGASITASWAEEQPLVRLGSVVTATTFPDHTFVAHPLTLVASKGQVAPSTTPGTVTVRGPGGATLTVRATGTGHITVE